MSEHNISAVSISELLEKLQNREWLIPKFQREFVWSVEQVKELVVSIIHIHPIGMITLWAQPDDGALDLEPLSLREDDTPVFISTLEANANKHYAILDGRQRATAISIAFGGLRSSADRRNKFSGKFFLNVASGDDETNLVVYLKDTDLQRRSLTTKAAQISHGLFPLSSEDGITLHEQWIGYVENLNDPSFYLNGALPQPEELARRRAVLSKAFRGIMNTRLPVYSVSEKFSLGMICEIFETLNTTGTKVSTVDLIHSWLFSDTQEDEEGPFQLREWIQEMGQFNGSFGWADLKGRPELMAQIATACYVARDEDQRPRPRPVGGRVVAAPVATIKAGDLLATPKDHWKEIKRNQESIAAYLSDFQDLVAGGKFPWFQCPYPTIVTVYAALRWHHEVDGVTAWSLGELNPLFRAFFWRNALAGRYDQGMVSRVGQDIRDFKEILNRRQYYETASSWLEFAEAELLRLIGPGVPSREQLVEFVSKTKLAGALQRALELLLYTRPRYDIIKPDLELGFRDGLAGELHHIYPKAWLKDNMSDALIEKIGNRIKERTNSIANLMLLSRESNNYWKTKSPNVVLQQNEISFDGNEEIFDSLFISQQAYGFLSDGPARITEFWDARTEMIVDEILRRMKLVL